MERLNNKGVSALEILVGIMFIVLIMLLLPYISSYIGLTGLSLYSNKYVGNITQGIVISSYTAPSSVSPSSTFGVTLYVSNNANGENAHGVFLCLDNLGILINSSPTCRFIPNIFSGITVPESFTLSTPSNGAYGNIPYIQDLGYYLNYSYYTHTQQSVEFVSSSSYSRGDYPTPTVYSTGSSSGPVLVNTTLTQPIIYGQSGELNIVVDNYGRGVVIGPINMSIVMDSKIINISNPKIFGLSPHVYSNGTVVFTISKNIPASGVSFTIPINLVPSEESYLSSSSIPYISSNIQIYVSYDYIEEGFIPISLNTEDIASS